MKLVMEEQIWYELKSINDLNQPTIDITNLSIIHIDSYNLKTHHTLIQLEIDKFNSEIKWDNMWDINECMNRISKNHNFFIFSKNNLPIGHVWYDTNYLYNAYVSNERVNGESAWFIIETIKTIINNKIPNITLHTEIWNIRAQKFWEKIGFVVIKK